MNNLQRLLLFIFNIEHLIIVFFALGLLGAICLITVNISFLNPISESVENFSITDVFYEIENSQTDKDECQIISIVDITDKYARGDIAEVLANIAMCEPKALGVDIIFEGIKDDNVGNDILKDVVEMLPANTVFATKLIDYNSDSNEFTSSVRSFFAEDMCIKEGFTNLNDNMSGSKIRDMSTQKIKRGEVYDSFSVRLSELCGISVPNKGIVSNNRINYKNVDFPIIPADSIYENIEYIKDKIVLFGTIREEADMHSTPIGKMPGVKIHAYSLLTLLENQKMVEVNNTLLFVITILICWILEVCICGIYIILRKKNSVLAMFLADSDIVRDVIIVMGLFILYLSLFILFASKNIIIEGTLIFGCMAMLSFAIETYGVIVNILYNKYQWEWLGKISNYISK